MTEKPRQSCPLLDLPLEIRLQIWRLVLTPAEALVMKSLFIRAFYRTRFMTMQNKYICTNLLGVCRSISEETLPILYAQPHWKAACRFENLASQIGVTNFCLIKRMSVSFDDLPSIVGSLLLDLQESGTGSVASTSSIELKLELESRALLENIMGSQQRAFPGGTVVPWTPFQRRLKFSNLEVLEVEAYQAIALTHLGNRNSRLEGLRLCKFATEILEYHPGLSVLVQEDQSGFGFSDAIDLTMGRVTWRFLREVKWKHAKEMVVDLENLQNVLRGLVEEDEIERSKDLLKSSWTQGGKFQQYPYLTRA